MGVKERMRTHGKGRGGTSLQKGVLVDSIRNPMNFQLLVNPFAVAAALDATLCRTTLDAGKVAARAVDLQAVAGVLVRSDVYTSVCAGRSRVILRSLGDIIGPLLDFALLVVSRTLEVFELGIIHAQMTQFPLHRSKVGLLPFPSPQAVVLNRRAALSFHWGILCIRTCCCSALPSFSARGCEFLLCRTLVLIVEGFDFRVLVAEAFQAL